MKNVLDYTKEELELLSIDELNDLYKESESLESLYNTEQLANLTEGFSHADISSVIEKSLRLKVGNIIKEIEENHIDKMGYITEKGIEEAIEEHKRDFIKNKQQSLGFAQK